MNNMKTNFSNNINAPDYVYRAKVVKVYDGDTITVDIDLGFGVILKKQSLRLLHIDTPEVRGAEREEGLAVRDFVSSKILGKNVVIKTYKADKKGKYGRWLCELFYEDENINKKLVDMGLAKIINY